MVTYIIYQHFIKTMIYSKFDFGTFSAAFHGIMLMCHKVTHDNFIDETIVKASGGDPAAMQAVLDRYAGFIRYFSRKNGYYNTDMENHIKTKLIFR